MLSLWGDMHDLSQILHIPGNDSTAFLRYGAYPYSAVFCTAVAVYGTVVSPTTLLAGVQKRMVRTYYIGHGITVACYNFVRYELWFSLGSALISTDSSQLWIVTLYP